MTDQSNDFVDRRNADLHKIQAEVAAQGARLSGFNDRLGHMEGWLREISEALRKRPEKNFAPVYVLGLAVITGLVTIGTFALTPLYRAVEQQGRKIESLQLHDADGHPTAVIDRLKDMDAVHTRERQENKLLLGRAEDRMDAIERELTRLDVIADERTERFKRTLEMRDKLIDQKSSDRWSGSQQQVFAEAIRHRLDKLEEQNRRRGHRRGQETE